MDKSNVFLDLLRAVAPEGLPGWLLALSAAGLGVGVVIGVVSVIGLVSIWSERKVAGHIQCRFGPMYVGGWHGWAQTIADGIKLIAKEDLIPRDGDRVLFVLAPAVVLGSIFAALTAMPLAPDVWFADLSTGVFLILAFSSLTTIGVVMAGWASNSKWSIYGAMREAAQVIAYEIPLGVSLLVPIMVLGTFNLLEASALQSGWLGMKWVVFQNPFAIPALAIYGVATLAETKRAPFDLPEAESELVAGFLTEYSGIRWSFFFLEEYAAMFLMSVVGAFFFLGGFESPFTALAASAFDVHGGDPSVLGLVVYNAVGFLTLVVKGCFGVFLMMWLRWTLPRIRIDQVMTIGYKYLTPLALLCVLGAGVWEAIFH